MKTQGRYDIQEVIGEGGMGIVYLAYDSVLSRKVTLKTLKNPQDKLSLDLFKRECTALSNLAHPNIVEIFDVGEAQDGGGTRPYFVMPFLSGVTLDKLLRKPGARLSIERSVNIAHQICRGLQAAHDRGLLHRDLKPSNIFILEDDSVKIIDFGVAQLADQRTVTGLKGTLAYMSPEQTQLKPVTRQSDQFSLAVICYEMLAFRHPFKTPWGETSAEGLVEAIQKQAPPAITEINASVNLLLSQVVQKGLAKETKGRFADVREFGDHLQKAFRNEPIAIFDPGKTQPRLDRARKAMQDGDLEFAWEITRELEAESYFSPEVALLRQEIEGARRAGMVKQLLDIAKRRCEDEEYLLALQKVQDALDLDPVHTQALTLKGMIETKRAAAQGDDQLKLAQQHLDNGSVDLAREAAEKFQQLRPKDSRGAILLGEILHREQETIRVRQEKEKAYLAALQAFDEGDVTGAISKAEQLLDLDRRSPESAQEQSACYQEFYEKIRSKRDFLDAKLLEAKRCLAERNLSAGLDICELILTEYPHNVVFQALRFDLDEAGRRQTSAFIANIEKGVADEPDLDQKVALLEEAVSRCPSEGRFVQSLDRYRSRRDLVQSIAGRAKSLENAGQFADALNQWEIVRSTYPQYPGLDVEVERLKRRRDSQRRDESRTKWILQIDQSLNLHNFERANSLIDDALKEFPNDPEILALLKSAQAGLTRSSEAQALMVKGQEFLSQYRYDEGFSALRDAAKLDPRSHTARNALCDALLQRATVLLDADWRKAEPLISETLEIDPDSPHAKSLRTIIQDHSEGEEITHAMSRAREFEIEGQGREAIELIDATIAKFPSKDSLWQRRSRLLSNLPATDQEGIRAEDLEQVRQFAEEYNGARDDGTRQSIYDRTKVFRTQYHGDAEFDSYFNQIPANSGYPNPQSDLEAPVDDAALPESISTKANPDSSSAIGSSSRVNWKIGAGAIGVAIVIGFAFFLFKHHNPPVQPSSGTKPGVIIVSTKVAITGKTKNAAVTGTNGDVTQLLESGIPAGKYVLTDSKPGFQPLRQELEIGSHDGPLKTIEARWTPLLTAILFGPAMDSAGRPLGHWSLDGTVASENQSPSNLADGRHEIAWSDGQALTTKLPFLISAGFPVIEPWQSETQQVGALAVAITSEGVTTRLSQLKIRYDAGAGLEESSSPDLSWNPASAGLNIWSEWDSMSGKPALLGRLDKHDRNSGGLLYVSLIRRDRISAKDAQSTLADIEKLSSEKRFNEAYLEVKKLLSTPNLDAKIRDQALKHKKSLETLLKYQESGK